MPRTQQTSPYLQVTQPVVTEVQLNEFSDRLVGAWRDTKSNAQIPSPGAGAGAPQVGNLPPQVDIDNLNKQLQDLPETLYPTNRQAPGGAKPKEALGAKLRRYLRNTAVRAFLLIGFGLMMLNGLAQGGGAIGPMKFITHSHALLGVSIVVLSIIFAFVYIRPFWAKRGTDAMAKPHQKQQASYDGFKSDLKSLQQDADHTVTLEQLRTALLLEQFFDEIAHRREAVAQNTTAEALFDTKSSWVNVLGAQKPQVKNLVEGLVNKCPSTHDMCQVESEVRNVSAFLVGRMGDKQLTKLWLANPTGQGSDAYKAHREALRIRIMHDLAWVVRRVTEAVYDKRDSADVLSQHVDPWKQWLIHRYQGVTLTSEEKGNLHAKFENVINLAKLRAGQEKQWWEQEINTLSQSLQKAVKKRIKSSRAEHFTRYAKGAGQKVGEPFGQGFGVTNAVANGVTIAYFGGGVAGGSVFAALAEAFSSQFALVGVGHWVIVGLFFFAGFMSSAYLTRLSMGRVFGKLGKMRDAKSLPGRSTIWQLAKSFRYTNWKNQLGVLLGVLAGLASGFFGWIAGFNLLIAYSAVGAYIVGAAVMILTILASSALFIDYAPGLLKKVATGLSSLWTKLKAVFRRDAKTDKSTTPLYKRVGQGLKKAFVSKESWKAMLRYLMVTGAAVATAIQAWIFFYDLAFAPTSVLHALPTAALIVSFIVLPACLVVFAGVFVQETQAFAAKIGLSPKGKAWHFAADPTHPLQPLPNPVQGARVVPVSADGVPVPPGAAVEMRPMGTGGGQQQPVAQPMPVST